MAGVGELLRAFAAAGALRQRNQILASQLAGRGLADLGNSFGDAMERRDDNRRVDTQRADTRHFQRQQAEASRFGAQQRMEANHRAQRDLAIFRDHQARKRDEANFQRAQSVQGRDNGLLTKMTSRMFDAPPTAGQEAEFKKSGRVLPPNAAAARTAPSLVTAAAPTAEENIEKAGTNEKTGDFTPLSLDDLYRKETGAPEMMRRDGRSTLGQPPLSLLEGRKILSGILSDPAVRNPYRREFKPQNIVNKLYREIADDVMSGVPKEQILKDLYTDLDGMATKGEGALPTGERRLDHEQTRYRVFEAETDPRGIFRMGAVAFPNPFSNAHLRVVDTETGQIVDPQQLEQLGLTPGFENGKGYFELSGTAGLKNNPAFRPEVVEAFIRSISEEGK